MGHALRTNRQRYLLTLPKTAPTSGIGTAGKKDQRFRASVTRWEKLVFPVGFRTICKVRQIPLKYNENWRFGMLSPQI